MSFNLKLILIILFDTIVPVVFLPYRMLCCFRKRSGTKELYWW